MKLITNSLGSGDWLVVQDDQGNELFSGHRVDIFALADLLSAELIELNDEEMNSFA